VEGELTNTLRDEQHARVESAVDLLVSLHAQVATASQFGPRERVIALDRADLLTALHSLAERTDPILAGTALAALLRLGDLDHLGDAISYVERYGPPPGESTEPVYQGTDNPSYVRGQILHAIGLLDDDTAAPLLNPLLQDSDAWVRRNAADALRRICNVSSMPYFAAALDDQDPYVAQAAIYGLLVTYQRLHWSQDAWTEYKRIGGGVHTVPEWDSGMLPSVSEFETGPGPYRSWWKSWWETTGRTAYEEAVSAGGA
jgi:HEAT repeat protein